MNKMLLFVALILGALTVYVDSRPNWDDTGVLALGILVGCGLLGAVGPSRPWLWALCVGLWVPVHGIAAAGNYGALLALAFAFAGAYAGMGLRKSLIAS